MLGPSELAGMRLHSTTALEAEHLKCSHQDGRREACSISTRAGQGDVNFTPTSRQSGSGLMPYIATG